MLCLHWISPAKYRLLLRKEDHSVMRQVFLMVLNVNMLRLIDDLICRKLRGFFLEGDKEDLIGLLLMLIYPKMLAPVV